MIAPILRLRDATFIRNGRIVVPATSFDVYPGTRYAHFCAGVEEARAIAMLAAGLARCSHGSVLIGEYDPSVQPVHCKKITAFVPHDPLVMAPAQFLRYIGYRAALWNTDAVRAQAQAKLLLERLTELHEAFAYPLVAALLSSPRLLVLDRPQYAHAKVIREVARGCAIFSTHVDRETAAEFAALREEQLA